MSPRARQLLLALALAASVLAVYGQVRSHGFIEYDDPGYVTDNSPVRRGLTLDGVRWAFTSGHMGNWHPVTWLSHMLDVQLFGLDPGAHHLVNLGLHVVNTLLLFALLSRLTGAPWPSAVVAALFGIHPLHVESVAWISERKDVLSTLFWFLALWSYLRWVETRAPRWYAALAVCFGLGLMAKPMLVTLPFTLLLLDVWPLKRLPLTRSDAPAPAPRRDKRRAASIGAARTTPIAALLWEKAPLFGLTLGFSVVAYLTQLWSGAMTKPGALPLVIRVGNALVAYVRYLVMAVWPSDLAVLYPYDVHLPGWQIAASAIALLAVTALVLRGARRHPYALVGWLWYLGTLVPVIGLVQIGNQALADRYTYVPLIGIFIMLAWYGRELHARGVVPMPLLAGVAVAAIAAYAVVARAQVALWQNSELLLTHALQVTRNNSVAHNNLGVALAARGRLDEAQRHYQDALRIDPDYADAHHNVGLLLWRQGRREEAAAQYRLALQTTPRSAQSHSNLGVVLTELGQYDEAITHLREAVWLDPQFAGAHNNLGNALRDSGRLDEALAAYEEARRIRPDYGDPYNNIGGILAQQGRPDEAIAEFRAAQRLDPDSGDAHLNLGILLSEMGKPQEAMAEYAAAVRLSPSDTEMRTRFGNALLEAGQQAEAIEQFSKAVELSPDNAAAQANLAVALTQAGQLQGAIAHFEESLRLAPDNAQVHNDLGVALFSSGRGPEAIAHFETALRLDPSLPDAKLNLEVARGAPAPGPAK